MSEHSPQTMDYAAAAARGAHQSAEEARAPPVPTIIPTEPTTATKLPDVDSGSVTVVPPTYPSQDIKTETQAVRIDLENAAKEREKRGEQHHGNSADAATGGRATEEGGEGEEPAEGEKKVKGGKGKEKEEAGGKSGAKKEGVKRWMLTHPTATAVNLLLGGAAAVGLGFAVWRRYRGVGVPAGGDWSWGTVGALGGCMAAVVGVEVAVTRPWVVGADYDGWGIGIFLGEGQSEDF